MKYYSEDHEWVEVSGGKAFVGISEYMVARMGGIIHVELPEEDDDLISGDKMGVVESERASADIYSPISGTVVAVNEALCSDPCILNESPEDQGWLCCMGNIDIAETGDMMSEDNYLKYLKRLCKKGG